MAKKTTEELKTELQEVVKKHNEALETIQQCKNRAIQIQAILEDRQEDTAS
tara:strand:+ start:2655 stop:2807 length:153 start_codon:yes stop_codon:yes gene_type:complete